GGDRAVDLAERIAKAERLRGLASGGGREGNGNDAGRVAVELASHAATRIPRERSGERLYPGERISVTITNLADETRYVALFDIDTGYEVSLLSSDQPSGWRLAPGQTKVVGAPDGVALSWDVDVPRTGERLETLVVVSATEPQQFGLLETARNTGTRGMGLSELEALLVEAGTGTRGWPAAAAGGGGARFRAETIDFYLVPGTKPEVDEPPFAIREVPDASQRAIQRRALIRAPKRVAVRLVALRVRNNKALFRAAVRLDALVITASGKNVAATPFTFRFGGVADGDLLPLDNLLLYLGAVRDFLDIAVWVNRDENRTEDLARLFEEAVADPKTSQALTVVGGLVLAAPQVALAVGAVAAIATLVRVASGLVTAAVGKE